MSKNQQCENIEFSTASEGYYALQITASCLRGGSAIVKIDDISFREIPAFKNVQRYNIPASWNGNKLLGKKQTNIYIIHLEKGNHHFEFTYNDAKLDNWNLEQITDISKFTINVNVRANMLDCQPLLNLILVDLPLASVSAKVSTRWYRRQLVRGDGDDVKLIIDNQVQVKDVDKSWLWTASAFDLSPKTQEKEIVCNLNKAIHYVEFWADRSPAIDSVTIYTKPHYTGDFWCRPDIRQPYGEDKAVLGIYLEGGPRTINNKNVKAFYGSEELKLGKVPHLTKYDEQIMGAVINRFDFDTEIAHDEGTNWFYYGVDSSWKTFRPDWRDASKWKIKRL